MREILFRGKRLDNGKWIEGWYQPETTLIHHNGEEEFFGVSIAVKDDFGYMNDVLVDPNTIGQYTGMNIYGERIFEGDILKLDYIGQGKGVQGVAEVVFKYGKFCMPWGHRKELVPLDGFCNVTMEIIGNVHDNPELLEEA